MAGAPKGQKRITVGLVAQYKAASPEAKKAMLTKHTQYGKKSPAEMEKAIEAKGKSKPAAKRKGKGKRKKMPIALKAATYAQLTLEECGKAQKLLTAAQSKAVSSAKADEAKKKQAKIKALKAELAKLMG